MGGNRLDARRGVLLVAASVLGLLVLLGVKRAAFSSGRGVGSEPVREPLMVGNSPGLRAGEWRQHQSQQQDMKLDAQRQAPPPPPPPPPPAKGDDNNASGPCGVIVLGMHHSMTSLVTKLMVDGGLFAGSMEELIIRRDNPLKYWELRAAVEADQAYFDRALRGQRRGPFDWLGYNLPDRVHPLDPLWKKAQKAVSSLASRAQARNACYLAKDPRMSIVADPWLSAVRGSLPVCVILVRDPEETSVRFLDYNNGPKVLSVREWYSMWEQYTLRAFRSCQRAGALVVPLRYENLTEKPSDAVRAVLEEIRGADPRFVGKVFPERLARETVPAGFAEKHRIKQRAWQRARQLVVPPDLVSAEGRAVWDDPRSARVHSVPPWIPLATPKAGEAYVVVLLGQESPHAVDSAKALLRSVLVHDSSRPFFALTDRSSMPVSAALHEAGWHIRFVDDLSSSNADSELAKFASDMRFDAALVVPLGCVARANPAVLFSGAESGLQPGADSSCPVRLAGLRTTALALPTQSVFVSTNQGVGRDVQEALLVVGKRTSVISS